MSSMLLSIRDQTWEMVTARFQPINERAWTLQESIVPSRLLIFAGIEAFWKCRTKFLPSSQPKRNSWVGWSLSCGYISHSVDDDIAEALRETRERRDSEASYEAEDRNDPEASYGMREGSDSSSYYASYPHQNSSTWMSLVENYTNRQVSDEKDNLPAISAIAKKYSQVLECEYLAGLWRKNLLFNLMWQVDRETYGRSLLTYQAPSWSWASIEGKVDTGSTWVFNPLVEILHCSTRLASEAAPYGAVTYGELIIRGHLKEVQLNMHKRIVFYVDHPDVEHHGLVPDVRVTSNVEMSSRSGRARPEDYESTWFLIFGMPSEEFGLILGKLPSQDCYQRIAWFSSDPGNPPFWWEQPGWEPRDKVTVKIV